MCVAMVMQIFDNFGISNLKFSNLSRTHELWLGLGGLLEHDLKHNGHF